MGSTVAPENAGTLKRTGSGKYFAEFSIGGGQRKGAVLATCTTEEEAKARKLAIARLVGRLRESGHAAMVPNTIRDAGALNEDGMRKLARLVERIAAGKEPGLAQRHTARREGPASVQPPQAAGVYFVQSAEPGNPIKIGVARSIARRLAGLQTAHAWPLVLRAWMPGGSAEEEALHLRFASARLRGEWFHATQAIESLIAECREAHHAS